MYPFKTNSESLFVHRVSPIRQWFKPRSLICFSIKSISSFPPRRTAIRQYGEHSRCSRSSFLDDAYFSSVSTSSYSNEISILTSMQRPTSIMAVECTTPSFRKPQNAKGRVPQNMATSLGPVHSRCDPLRRKSG